MQHILGPRSQIIGNLHAPATPAEQVRLPPQPSGTLLPSHLPAHATSIAGLLHVQRLPTHI
jgi:hypothetical protein